jgi:hypothetical protein
MPRKKKPEVEISRPAEVKASSPVEVKAPDGEGPKAKTLRVAFSADFERYGYPPPFVKVGMREIELPDSATQLAGFELEAMDAHLLVTNVAGFKMLKRKGE